MEPKELCLKKTFIEAWNLFKAQFGSVIFFGTLLLIASNILSNILNPGLLSFFFSFLSFYFSFALMNVCLNVSRGIEPQFGMLSIDAKKLLNYLLASFLLVIGFVIIGFLGIFLMDLLIKVLPQFENFIGALFGVAAVLFALFLVARLYLLLPFFILDQGLGTIEALKQSWKASREHLTFLIVFALAVTVLYLVGALLFLVGLIVAIPLAMIAQALIYRELTKGE